MIIWNPWHGCHKVSEGCEHCYMYFLDSKLFINPVQRYGHYFIYTLYRFWKELPKLRKITPFVHLSFIII